MSTINSCTITDPFGAEATCAKFTIDDLTKAFKLAGTTVVGLRYTLSFWVKSEAAGSLIVYSKECASSTEWVKYVITFTATSENLMIGFNKTGTYYIYHPQLELGNKATDWKLSPEDVDEQINNCPTREEVTAAITASREGIELNVSTYYTSKADFENLSIGGRNLARNTANSATVTATDDRASNTWETYTHRSWWKHGIKLENNTEYVLSFDYVLDWSGTSYASAIPTNATLGVGIGATDAIDGTYKADTWGSIAHFVTYGEGNVSGHFVYKMSGKDLGNYPYFAFRPLRTGADYTGLVLTISNFKLEKGNTATDWTPAPEDIENRVKTAESAIKVNTDNIELRVKEADLTGNYVISKINLDSTTATIEAKHINLTGYVTMTNLSTSGATTINGANITTGTISADRIDVTSLFAKTVSATNLTVTGNSKLSGVTATDLTVTGNSTFTGTIDGSKITGSTYEATNSSTGDTTYVTGGRIQIEGYGVGVPTKANIGGDRLTYSNEETGQGMQLGIHTVYGVPYLSLSSSDSFIELEGALTVGNTAEFSGLVNMTDSLRVTGSIYEGGTALSSKYAQLNTTVKFPGITLDDNGAYIYGENNKGNIYFRYRATSTSDYSYTSVASIVNSLNGLLPKSGGTITNGDLTVYRNSATEANILVTNTVGSGKLYTGATGYFGLWSITHNKYLCRITNDGVAEYQAGRFNGSTYIYNNSAVGLQAIIQNSVITYDMRVAVDGNAGLYNTTKSAWTIWHQFSDNTVHIPCTVGSALTLGNGVYLKWNDSGGTARQIAHMNSSNLMVFGNTNYATSLRGSSITSNVSITLSSDRDAKHEINDISQNILDAFMNLRFVQFRYNANGERLNVGLIYQEAKEIFEKHGIYDFAGIRDPLKPLTECTEEDIEDGAHFGAIAYDQFQNIHMAVTQRQQLVIGELQNGIVALNLTVSEQNQSIEQLKSQYLSQEERMQYVIQQLEQAQAEIGQLQTQLKALA